MESRDFVHAADVALAMDAVVTRAPFEGEVYNVAAGQEVTIRALAELLMAALGIERTVEFSGTSRQGDPLRWQAEIGRMRGLGWEPQVTLEEGMQSVARWSALELGGVR
jgi:UDP-glucose 4-epimerase